MVKGMNIEKVKYRINNPAQLQAKEQKAPNFNGRIKAPSVPYNVNIAEEIKPFMPSAVKGMKKISDNIGETQNIIINALGTGLVAPIFIKWNPLSKTDEDTRTYSAWRQPVSAIITVATQVGVTIPFNRMIDRRANSGFYDTKYNKTLFQDKDYIAKIVKQQYPHASKNVRNMIVAERIQEQKNTLLRMIKEDNVIMHTDTGKPLALTDEKFRALLNKVLDDKLEYENGELKKCQETTIAKKIVRGEYYRTHSEEARQIFTDIKDRLDKTTEPNSVKKYIKKLKQTHKGGDPELIAIFNDILDRNGNNKPEMKIAMQDKLSSILRDLDWYAPMESKEALETAVKEFETRTRINPINSAIELLTQCKEMVKDKKKVGLIENFIDTTVRNDTSHRLFKFKFSDEIAKELQKQVKNNIKAHKQISGMIVSFLMLPVSCTMLNWSYPRFMDAVFPNLSNKKHPKEIKDLVNKANDQMEVKHG